MNKINSIIIRYAVLLILAFPNLYWFYLVLSPLTIHVSYFLFDLFFDTVLVGNSIFISNSFDITFIDACIAGAAYYLLLMLNLSTPDIKDRFNAIAFSFATFFAINIFRIFILGLMYVYSSSLFSISHKLFWYAGSTIFVVFIWFASVKIFKIKELPFYSDIKYLKKQIWKS